MPAMSGRTATGADPCADPAAPRVARPPTPTPPRARRVATRTGDGPAESGERAGRRREREARRRAASRPCAASGRADDKEACTMRECF